MSTLGVPWTPSVSLFKVATMKNITVKVPAKSTSYPIEFYDKLGDLKRAGKARVGDRKHIFVTDKNVLKKTKVFPASQRAKPGKNIVVLKPGEKSKRWDSIDKILKAAFENGLDRDSVIVAIGGGVVGDMAGFAASIYMRGIPFIQVPTTLLAMVDASIGGKTGIDSEYGKNLIGSFQAPEAILVGPDFLKTLPDVEVQNGICEMVKHGIIGAPKHFKALEKLSKKPFKTVRSEIFGLVPDSIKFKQSIVEKDLKEAGIRGHLNFGHTFGHAIEHASNYRVPHGRAVAIGCVMASQYAAERKICKHKLVDRIENIFHRFGIEIAYKIDEEKLWAAMGHDKKKKDGKLRLILPKKIGKVVYHTVE